MPGALRVKAFLLRDYIGALKLEPEPVAALHPK